MDAAPISSLQRLISRRSLIRRDALRSFFLSVIATACLLLLLLDLLLLVSLLVDRGRIELSLSRDEAARFSRLSGLELTDSTNDPGSDAADPVHVYFDEHGILPAVWQMRDAPWGGLVASLYRSFGWLQMNLMGLICLLLAGVLLFIIRQSCLSQLRRRAQFTAVQGITAIRRQLHRQVLRIGPEDLDGTGHDAARDLFLQEADSVRDHLFESISILTRYPLEIFGLAVVMLSLDWRLSLQWIAPLALGFLYLINLRKGAIKAYRLAEDRSLEEQQSLLGTFKNSRLIRGLGMEQVEHEQFQKNLERYHSRLTEASLSEDAVSHPGILVTAAGAILVAFLLFLMFSNILDRSSPEARMTIAAGTTFIAALVLAVPGIRALIHLSEVNRDLRVAADKIQRYLDVVPAVSQAVGAKFLQPLSRTLHFENVKYQTPSGVRILDGVDFKLDVDQCYAIVSMNPLESRALALMLPRFLEPREGRVMIDGEDIAWATLESLRAETVFVAADDPPFEGTVFDNIRGGQPDLSLQQVTEAAKVTHAHNFIVKLFNGYETVLTGQSDSLDVGQRFRLSLARAIAQNPALLIIEEPDEALDEDTKNLLTDAYDRICRERTVIFLPRRMSTIRRTDQIIVLHDGKVAAVGPHAKLVTQSPVYRHWEYVHFNEYRREA